MDSRSRTAPQPRPPLPERPDPALSLIEAVRRRDSLLSRQLAQRWVHRQGLAAFEVFRLGGLQQAVGPEAYAWLNDLLPPDPAAETAASAHAAESRETAVAQASSRHGMALASGQAALGGDAASDRLEQRVSADVDAAIAAMLASFPEGAFPEPAAEAAALAQPFTAVSPPQAEAAAPEACFGLDPFAELPFGWGDSSSGPTPPASGSDPGDPLTFATANDQDPAEDSDRLGLAEAPAGGLRHRLVRRFPGAARWMRDVLDAAHSISGWSREDLEQHSQMDNVELPSAAGREGDEPRQAALSDPFPLGDPFAIQPAQHQARADAVSVDSAHRLALEDSASSGFGSLQAVPPTSTADRLRQRLQHPDSGLGQQPPAPRPSGLAELSAWLPASDLPRAS